MVIIPHLLRSRFTRLHSPLDLHTAVTAAFTRSRSLLRAGSSTHYLALLPLHYDYPRLFTPLDPIAVDSLPHCGYRIVYEFPFVGYVAVRLLRFTARLVVAVGPWRLRLRWLPTVLVGCCVTAGYSSSTVVEFFPYVVRLY